VSAQETVRGQRVTALELFFDLVVVFAITQVTALMSRSPTWEGLLQGLLVLAALWWAWAGYAWLTNHLDPEEGGVRIAIFAAAAAMLIVSLAVPGAFGDDALTFGIAYMVVRVILLVLFALAGRGNPQLLRNVAKIVPPGILGPGLLVVASFLDGSAQIALWVTAFGIDYFGILFSDIAAWSIAPEHFAERNGLIIIIALGESIFSIGVGAAGAPLDMGVIAAAILGVVVAATLWWSYFDWVAIVNQVQLANTDERLRPALARDAYSYLHLPMVAGVVLFALGLKTTIHDVDEPLTIVTAFGLCGGLALYFLAHVALRLRMAGGLAHGRPVAAVALLALIPVATNVTALVSLALVTVVCTALIAYEALRHRDTRAYIRREREAFSVEEAFRLEMERRNERD